MPVPSTIRRATSTVVAALLAVGVVPLLASPASAAITSVSPSFASNSNSAFEITVTGDGQPPFDPLVDTVVLRRNGTTETLPACTTVRTRPTGPAGTPQGPVSDATKLVATCNLQAAAPAPYDVIVNRPPDAINTEPTPTTTDTPPVPAPDEVRLSALNILGGQPTITAFSPPARGRGTQTATNGATITGTNLSNGTKVEFLVNGVVDPAVTFVNGAAASNMTSLPGTLHVSGAALLGPHDLRVTTTDTGVATLANALTVSAAPTVTALSPPSVGQNAKDRVVTITGTGFQPGVTITIPTSPDGVTIGTVSFVNSTTITAPFSATSAAGVASRTLAITNPDGGTVSAALAVTAAPTISAPPSPATRGQNSAPQSIALTGSGFITTAGQQTQFALNPATGVTINSATVTSATSATLNVTVAPGAPVGTYRIRTTNFDGGNAESSEANSLKVSNAPSITSISPGSRVRGFSGNVTVTGANFPTSGAAPTANFGPGITTNTTTLGTANSFTANITIDPAAEQGVRNVVVTNPDGGTGACSCFTVDAIGVSSTTPAGVVNGAPRAITINGAGFSTSGTPTVTLIPAGSPAYQPNLVGTNVTVAPTGNTLSATFDFTLAAGTLAYTVKVVNPNGDSGTCTNCFTVVSNPPTVTGVSPASKVQGAQDQAITITGTNFSNGAALTFERAGITVDSLEIVSPTQLTAVIDVAQGTLTTPGDVTVTLPSGQSGFCDNCFTATAAPTLTGANPSSVAQGGSRTVTFTGTGFASGATLTFGNPGVTLAGAPTVVNATTMTAPVAVASDTAPGPVSVSIVNTDGGTGTCASSCFAINGKPTVTSVTPNTGGMGKTVNVQIAGTGFPAGIPVVTAGEGIVVTNPSRATATLITATFTISTEATGGNRTINVTTSDGGNAACVDCFKVISSPQIAGISPETAKQGSTLEVIVSGVDFSAEPKPTVSFGPDVTVDSISESTATGVVAMVSIARTAATGARAVTVTNPDGGAATCSPACFTITAGPTVTSVTPSSIARGRNGVEVTVAGDNFAEDSTISFGEGVTVATEPAPAVTISADGADQITATVSVSPTATPGARTVTVTNPADGNASGVCTTCLTISAGRAMVVEVFDTKGTAATTDDVLTDKPVSGTPYRVQVTAKNGEAASAPTDTTFTGPVGLSNAPADTTFAPGTCAAAVAGVATCSNVVFGDLGSRTLAAQGTGSDSDRRGTVGLVTQSTGLEFTAAPTTGSTGDTLTFTVRPTTPVANANRDGYNAVRTLALTGTGANREAGPLSCDAATCSFSISWSTQGAKTVRVSDNATPSRSTPTLNVTIAQVGLFKALPPSRILDTRSSNDTDGHSKPIGPNSAINVQATGRGGVPSTDVAAVVVNVTVDRPTTSGYLTAFPSGGLRPTASTLNFNRNDIVANLAVVKVGTGGKISLYNYNGNTSTILDVVGYYTTTATGQGGRLVGVEPERIFDTAFGAPVGPGQTVTATVTDRGGVPATGVDSVILSVSALSPTANAFLTVYPANVARPLASTLNFRAGNNVGNLIYAKVSDLGQIKIFNANGNTRVALDVMGYVMKTGNESLGRFVSLPPTRVIDTRGRSNSPVVGKIGPGSAIQPKLTDVGGIPATGVSAVVFNLTATEGTSRSFLRAYPNGMTAPNTSNVHFNAGQNVANLVVVKVGDDGRVRIHNSAGAVHAIVDVVGYLTT